MGSAMSRLTWEDGQRGEEAGSRSIMDLLHSGFVNLGLNSKSRGLQNRAKVHSAYSLVGFSQGLSAS